VLTAQLRAEGAQACVITLAPVAFRIDEALRRRYVAGLAPPDADEVEIPAEDVELMPETLDLTAIAEEALALALPLYPRAPGAELGETVHAGAGVTPLADADLRPFAGLRGLAGKLAGNTGGDGGADG
jgi:uncharacterized metal-binding protein YceD (DUF177 family)